MAGELFSGKAGALSFLTERDPALADNRAETTSAPASVPGPAAADYSTAYAARWFNPWVRAFISSRTDGEVYDVSKDILSCDTNKSLADPAGTWSITLNPRRFALGRRNVTWADLFNRQDHVEIRMGLWTGDPGVTVMRGFVDNCHRIDATDGSGRGLPNRRILISGRDYAKIWLDFTVFYLQELGQYGGQQATNLLIKYWGFDAKDLLYTPAKLFSQIHEKLLAPKLERLRRNNPAVAAPAVFCEVPDFFQINAKSTNFQAYTGSLWNLMQMYTSPPFTEFMVRDVPGQLYPEFRWRWAPLCKPGNRLALPWTPHPKAHTLHGDDLTKYDVNASDNQRHTYFWAKPGQYGSIQTGLASGKQLAPGYIDGPGIDTFGFKDFEPSFNMYRFQRNTDLADDDSSKTRDLWVPQIKTLTQWLADTMLPNDTFLEGPLQSHLRPDLCIGDYVDVPEEGTRFYIESVNHSYTIGSAPTTAIVASRGQRLGDADISTPEGYKYAPGREIPGGSTTAKVPTAAEAEAEDEAAVTPPGVTAPVAVPALGSDVVENVIAIGAPLEARADYALGRRNYSKTTDLTAAYAIILKPGPSNPDGLKDEGGGIDCSEYTAFCFRHGAQIEFIPNAQQQYNATPRIPFDKLQRGDLLFFGGTTGGDVSGNNITHVGLYLGNGEMSNAQDVGQKVKRATITSGYWKEHFVSGGRCFPSKAT